MSRPSTPAGILTGLAAMQVHTRCKRGRTLPDNGEPANRKSFGPEMHLHHVFWGPWYRPSSGPLTSRIDP